MVTGVRWAESANRKNTHGIVDLQGKPKRTQKAAIEAGANFKLNKHGEVIMNDDNDEARRLVEQCYRTQKTMVNPIIDWSDDDVWNFLNSNGIEHCCLYDEGFTRLGCIGCPLSGSKNMIQDFERWPKYKELYIRAFQRMIDNHPGQIKILDPNANTKFRFELDDEGGVTELTSAPQTKRTGGSCTDGQNNGCSDHVQILPAQLQLIGGGRAVAEAMLRRWLKVALC